MSIPTTPVVTPTAYLTLHYRLAAADGGDLVSTFNEKPATLQLGTGQLAPFLEDCLMGLEEGAHRTFELQPEQGFGPRNQDLLQRIARTALGEPSAEGEDYAIGDMVEFSAPSGGRFTGVVRDLDATSVLFDFNHPLAGKALTFEVKIIGIL